LTIRRVDIRFALAVEPRSAAVFGALPEFRAGLSAAAIPIVTDAPDLAVATAERTSDAVAAGADFVVVEGGDVSRRLRRAGYRTKVIMPMPSPDLPELLLPLRDRRAARRLLTSWRKNPGWRGRIRYAVALNTAASGGAARLRPVFTVGSRPAGPPFPVAAAAALGVPADASWFLASPGPDALSRVVFVLARRGARQAEWALKVSRSRRQASAFVNEEAALAIVAAAGADVGRHAPRLLGRFSASGHECSLETAAAGERLATLLPRLRAAALPLLDDVAAWIVAMGRATAGAATSGAELDRLADNVLPRWRAPASLVTAAAGVPAVFAHHDLGSWNIVTDGQMFTALDWESARPGALPLWDLAYFLVHALPIADGTMNELDPAGAMLALLRGDTDSARILFRWLKAGADSLGVAYDAVPSIVTLCWLHHGLSHVTRGHLGATGDGSASSFVPPIERVAPAWLNDPRLGAEWPAWFESVR
jgi:hypothetical protein